MQRREERTHLETKPNALVCCWSSVGVSILFLSFLFYSLPVCCSTVFSFCFFGFFVPLCFFWFSRKEADGGADLLRWFPGSGEREVDGDADLLCWFPGFGKEEADGDLAPLFSVFFASSFGFSCFCSFAPLFPSPCSALLRVSLFSPVFSFPFSAPPRSPPPPVFGPFSGYYSQRMHAFSLIIKTLRTVIAEVMVTVGDGRGVRFSLAL